ncbi:SulP family inorganic anion transporter [Crenobacter intestini]|uniref:SulP family inorganic anion transporter n=1 Tax=Crenobacter intestini TaxID=2563443 RepID=UPI0014586944|nr:SulP family inorganic anion transporter [Crenobacter intestini]
MPAPRPLFAVLSGLLLGLIALTVAAAYASLLFQGKAAPYAGVGFSILLVGTAIGAALVARLSHQAGLVTGPDEASTIALASLVGSQLAAYPALSAEASALTVALMMALSGLLSGALFWLVGRFHLGRLVRYLPSPVVSGFLGGTGLLLLLAGLGLAAGVDGVSLAAPERWLALLEKPAQLACAVLLGLWLVFGGGRFGGRFFLPLSLLLAGGVFVLGAALGPWPLAQLQTAGWLYLPPVGGGGASGVLLGQLASVDWALLSGSLPGLLLVALIALLVMLLQLSALEQALKHDVEHDLELVAQGQANLLGGLFGSLPMVPFIGDTRLNIELAGPNRIAAVVVALVCLAGVFVGDVLMAWLPVFLLSGLLLYFGASLLGDAVSRARAASHGSDRAIIVTVLLAVNLLGIMEAALLGVCVTAVLFLLDYSRLDVVRQRYNARNAPSRISRPHAQRALLDDRPDWLAVYVLEGYLFFGGVQRLYDRIKAEHAADGPQVLLFDLKHVQGMDATALAVFERLAERMQGVGGLMLVSSARPQLERRLRPLSELGVVLATDLDSAVEQAERRMLAGMAANYGDWACAFAPLLAELAPYLETLQLRQNEALIRQDGSAPGLCFIKEGSVSVRLFVSGQHSLRLRRFVRGTVLGEISVYTGGSASATVYADEDTQVSYLTVAAIARLEQDNLPLALRLHRTVAAVMAERLQESNRSLQQATA